MGADVTRWSSGALTLELSSEPRGLRLVWTGRSEEREPGRFLVPVLTDALARAQAESARLIVDFTLVEYMNSSTFTPIVKLIERAKRDGVPLTLLYANGKKWQALSFSALRTFETSDGRVTVSGD